MVFEYLFSREINEQTESILFCDASLTQDDKDYICKCYLGIADHFDELSASILKYAIGYASIDRLVKGDLTAMLISAFELTYCPEIPAGASISEAVDLVKQFSTSKSSGFVNGVLASINREVRNDGENH